MNRNATAIAAPAETVALHLRVPCWAGQASTAVNGQPAPASVDKGYISLARKWGNGDTVEVHVPEIGTLRNVVVDEPRTS